MPWQSFFTVCEMVAPEIDLAFIGVVREGQVLYHCCSSECESPPLLKEPLGRPLGYFIFSLIGLKRTLFTNIFQRL